MTLTQLAVQAIGTLHPPLMFDIVRKQIDRTVPFAKLLGVAIDHLDGEGARVSVAQARHLDNHVGTFHAGVIYTACEAASGAALAGALLPVIMTTRFVVSEARIAYTRPARGMLTASAQLVGDAGQVIAALRSGERAELAIDVRARSGAEGAEPEDVASATFVWNLRPLAGR